MLLGAHVSIAGGVCNSIDRGEKIGCTAIQIFTKNQMQWNAKAIASEEVIRFKSRLKLSPIQSTLVHDSYLINLGSPDKEILEKSRASFGEEMERTEELNIPFLVFHPGSHMGIGESEGIGTIAESLNLLLDHYSQYDLTLLLENTAGQGTNLGYSFEQLAEIIQRVERKEKIGVCFDTAHAFASGYDIRSRNGYNETFIKFDETIGLEKLKAFHLNDTKKAFGSKVDRHENIGDGMIGVDTFQWLVNDFRFKKTPMILEIPGGELQFKKNLDLLKSLIKE